jgi:hypothetical protein
MHLESPSPLLEAAGLEGSNPETHSIEDQPKKSVNIATSIGTLVRG